MGSCSSVSVRKAGAVGRGCAQRDIKGRWGVSGCLVRPTPRLTCAGPRNLIYKVKLRGPAQSCEVSVLSCPPPTFEPCYYLFRAPAWGTGQEKKKKKQQMEWSPGGLQLKALGDRCWRVTETFRFLNAPWFDVHWVVTWVRGALLLRSVPASSQ